MLGLVTPFAVCASVPDGPSLFKWSWEGLGGDGGSRWTQRCWALWACHARVCLPPSLLECGHGRWNLCAWLVFCSLVPVVWAGAWVPTLPRQGAASGAALGAEIHAQQTLLLCGARC